MINRKLLAKFVVGLYIIAPSSLLAQKAAHHFPKDKMQSLHLLATYVIPYNFQFKGTTVGGLSGIDYNPEKQEYYMISDDRSQYDPSRFYTAKIHFEAHTIDTVEFTNVTFLRQANGQTYPNSKTDPAHTPDPEALRYDKATTP